MLETSISFGRETLRVLQEIAQAAAVLKLACDHGYGLGCHNLWGRSVASVPSE